MRSVAAGGLAALLLTSPACTPSREAWFTCVPLFRGETVAAAATRIAGLPGAEGQLWFQIFDPAASRFIDKNAYGRPRPGWRGCLADSQGGRGLLLPHAPVPALRVKKALVPPLVDRLAAKPEVLLGLALLVALLIALEVAENSPAMRARATVLRAFGDRFAREFERPLLRPVPGDRAVNSRVRVSPARRTVDILLRPANGRSYPNLADHGANVKYDVARVLRAIGDERFIPDRLSAEGRWVKVGCRVRSDVRLEGGP
jgi:hypothetical protein